MTTEASTDPTLDSGSPPPAISVRLLDPLLLLSALFLYVLQAILLWDWFVDDAAISFTYARHLGHGEGLVLTPGGERIEAYSNPLWVFLLAPYATLGISLFTAARVLSVLFGSLALVGVWRLTGALLSSRQLPWPGVAVLMTALHAPFAIWTQSGLEGPLYSCLLVWALVRTLEERAAGARPPTASLRPPFPWSAVLLFALAITRPEGILFFGVIVALRGAFWGLEQVWHGRPIPAGSPERPATDRLSAIAIQVALFLLLFGLYHLWHFHYFASWVPNTYYAKRPTGTVLERLLNRQSSGWIYVTGWFSRYGLHFLLPLVLLPLLDGTRRAGLGFGRLTLAGLTAAAVFFPIYSSGDWMREYRFMAPVAPLLLVLVVIGTSVAIETLPGLRQRSIAIGGGLAGLALVVGPAALSVPKFLDFRLRPEVSVADVKARADFFRGVRETLGLEGDVTLLDPDLGATSYASGLRVVDTWGLAEPTIARHADHVPFILDYVFEEVQPDLAHIFGYWNSQVKILDDPRWSSFYAALPNYRTRLGAEDGGNYVHRKHLRSTPKDLPPSRLPMQQFEGGLELVHAKLEARVLKPGDSVGLHLAWRNAGQERREVRMVTRLRGLERSIQQEHALIYGWVPLARWQAGEVLKERVVLSLPADLPAGAYALELEALAVQSGQVIPVLPKLEGALQLPKLVVGAQSVEGEVSRLLAQVERLLSSGALEDAEQAARQALATDGSHPAARAAMERVRERLLAAGLEAVYKLAEAGALRQAAQTFRGLWPRWYRHAQVREVGRYRAEQALEQARALEASGDYPRAIALYRATLSFDPSRAEARQRLEPLRRRISSDEQQREIPDDPRWIRRISLGTGRNGQLSLLQDEFRLGDPVISQIFWADPSRHRTRWRFFDPTGVERHLLVQPTEEGTGMSFAYVEAARPLGTWQVRVEVDDRVVGQRRFEVRDSGELQ